MREKWQNVREFLSHRSVARSYSFLILLFAVAGIAALDWAAKLRGDNQSNTPLTAIQSDAQRLFETPAWNYFHPVWNQTNKWSFNADNSDAGLFPVVDTNEILSDSSRRIEKEFRVTPGMKKRVAFWVEIYAKFSNRIKVLHDRNDPGIIYGYIDLRPLYRVMAKSPTLQARANEIERTIFKEFKIRLLESITNEPARLTTAAERGEIRAFLSKTGALSIPATLKLIENVRSQTGQRDEFLSALSRSAILLPHIETVFRRNGLPVALARIPFVESSFNPRATSNVGAVGIWQFMPATARQMIGADDQKTWADPIKQTASAVRLFKMYRTILPDWGMAVTAYNSGVGRLKQLSIKYKVKTIESLIAVPSDGLGFAGQNFYSEFIAANYVEAYKERIFAHSLSPLDLSLVLKGAQPFPKDRCDL